MNLDTARTVVLEDFLNTELGSGVGDLTQSQLDRYINEAETEACKRWNLIYDSDTAAVVQFATADGTRAYALHSKILRVERAEYYDSVTGTRRVLEHEIYETLEKKYGTSWRTDTGVPTKFTIRGRKMFLYPTPDTDAVVNLEVWRLPLNALVEDDDEFEVPEAYQQDLLHWAAYRARSRREEELGDPQGAMFHLQNFERVFGPPVSAQALQNSLENPSYIRFGLDDITENDDDD